MNKSKLDVLLEEVGKLEFKFPFRELADAYQAYMEERKTLPQQEPKQEPTLEEAAERILANNIDGLRDALNDDDLFFFYKGVVQCYGEDMAKWQKERMYSEEDMIDFAFDTYCYISKLMGVPFNLISENRLNAVENFKQFKKK